MEPRQAYAVLALGGCMAIGAAACSGDTVSTGLDCPGFTKIVSGGFSRTDERLHWTLEVESIPSEFVLNRVTVPDGMVDFGWQVNIDADGDGEFDHALTIEHRKVSGAAESTSSDVLSDTEHRVLEFTSATSAKVIGTFQAGLNGNTLTFEVDTAAFPEFAAVTSPSQSFWTVGYRDGSETCSDSWP